VCERVCMYVFGERHERGKREKLASPPPRGGQIIEMKRPNLRTEKPDEGIYGIMATWELRVGVIFVYLRCAGQLWRNSCWCWYVAGRNAHMRRLRK